MDKVDGSAEADAIQAFPSPPGIASAIERRMTVTKMKPSGNGILSAQNTDG
jgi:hypothetical protein